MAIVDQFLKDITEQASQRYKNSQAILSFDEYIHEVFLKPYSHLRNCAQYFANMWDSFGSYEVRTPITTLKRYRIFDADFLAGEGRIYGQERVQHELFANINNFVRSGRVDKLLLLHGPNGSSKTSIVQALVKAAEIYSTGEEGALYQFSFVFPKKEVLSGALGFSKSKQSQHHSYAYLSNDAVDTRLSSEQRDHPLMLLSLKERQKLFNKIKESSNHSNLVIPEILRIGELSHKNRQIFDALLSSYNGDLAQVFRHIRVERFYFSRRYKRGMSVVEPQMSVDASIQQITSDQSISALPSALRHLTLYEIFGPLVEANRGLIEYSDLFKRPIEAWKYLLVTCEQAQVSVGTLSLFFDLLMIATSNEIHLNSFREYPDWPSFKGRIELIRVPYLLRSVEEEGIYLNQIPKALNQLHIAPHSIELVARWAVLTRLEPPMAQKYPVSLQEVINDLSPEEKLELYDYSEIPTHLSQNQARELRAQIPHLFNEYHHELNYEGQFGASPREVRMMILNAAQNSRFDHLSTGAIFEQIEQLIAQKSSYDFLRREPVRGYRDATYLLTLVKRHYINILEDEVRNALGFYSKESYLELFTRYIMHVSAWTKKERLIDPLLQRQVDPDEQFMFNVEKVLLATNETKGEFRRQIIAQIGAFKLENPNNTLDYQTLFSSHLKRLKGNVFAEQKDMVHRVIRVFLRLQQKDSTGFLERDIQHAHTLQEGLFNLGYNRSSAQWAMGYLIQSDLAKQNQLDLKIDKV
jgi:serine protein kinase